VPQQRIEAAIEVFRAETRQELKPKFACLFRAATVGDSRRHLDDSILAVFRERHGGAIRPPDYQVRWSKSRYTV
jgi:hypothetical protein